MKFADVSVSTASTFQSKFSTQRPIWSNSNIAYSDRLTRHFLQPEINSKPRNYKDHKSFL